MERNNKRMNPSGNTVIEKRHGCDGCAEMEMFMNACRAFFTGGESGVRHG